MSNTERCRQIYIEAFEESEPFDTELFNAFSGDIKTLEIDGETVAMMFLLPCKLVLGGKEYEAEYIYAATTDKRYRGMGYMSRLMAEVCNKEDVFYFLKPATQELEGFYAKLGFGCAKAVKSGKTDASIGVCDKQKSLQKNWCDCPGKYILMYKKRGLKIEKIRFEAPME